MTIASYMYRASEKALFLNVINLWNPGAGMPVGLILLTAFLLGIVHGITPDEHTWPITFSYAIGSYSTRRGLVSGFIFSAAFTLQRMIGCVLAYLALARWMQSERVDAVVYVVVGVAMALAGAYILRLGRVFHLHFLPESLTEPGDYHDCEGAVSSLATPRSVTPSMAAIHGFIAGWGFGAFATILYTTLAPSMPNAAVSWLPGLTFGLGTMVTQVAAGALFGWWMRRRRLPEHVIALVARRVAGRTLFGGGLAFVAAGILSLVVPALANWQVATPLQVHNLDRLGLGFVLVIVVVLGIGGTSIVQALRQVSHEAEPIAA